jgi:hypothetical protein
MINYNIKREKFKMMLMVNLKRAMRRNRRVGGNHHNMKFKKKRINY